MYETNPLFKNMPNALDIHPSVYGHRDIARKELKNIANDFQLDEKILEKNLHPITKRTKDSKGIVPFESQDFQPEVDLWASDLLKSMVKSSKSIAPKTKIKKGIFQLLSSMSATL
jgi:hypothetical protein